MKKSLLVVMTTLAFSLPATAKDEFINQIFEPGANTEIAALSMEEMQETKGAFSPMVNAMAASTLVGAAANSWVNHIAHKTRHGSFASLESTTYAITSGAGEGAVSGVIGVPMKAATDAFMPTRLANPVTNFIAAKIGTHAIKKSLPLDYPSMLEDNPYNDYTTTQYDNVLQVNVPKELSNIDAMAFPY